MTNSSSLRITERIGYGFGDLASCLFWQTFTVFLLNFYTDVVRHRRGGGGHDDGRRPRSSTSSPTWRWE